MADQNIATDMSGRPVRRPTAAELIAAGPPPGRPSYDIILIHDGEQYADSGGKLYPFKASGEPDWDNPTSEADLLGD